MNCIMLGSGAPVRQARRLYGNIAVNPEEGQWERLLADGEAALLFCCGEDRETIPQLTCLLYALYERGGAGGAVYCLFDGDPDAVYRVKEQVLLRAAERKDPAFLRFLVDRLLFRAAAYDPVPDEDGGLWTLEYKGDALEAGARKLRAGHVALCGDMAVYVRCRDRILRAAPALLGAVGFLCGLDTEAECAGDPELRRFFARMATEEILPCIGGAQQEMLAYTLRVCQNMESDAADQVLLPQWNGYAMRATRLYVLPSIASYLLRFRRVPEGLSFSLAARAMLCAASQEGVAGQWTLLREDGSFPCVESAAVRRFARTLSCDMAPESLAYAFLADSALWQADLRELPGLEDAVAAQIGDIQRLGIRGALRLALGSE